ncbi:MAG: hypothetical protein KA479_10700 [Saprospiraceae bacterium]|nr:hypothetical protein [Saprospiraceae bacterium]
MNVDKHTIEALLERYFEAETSTEEELQLRRYFQSASIDPAFEQYQSLFTWQALEKSYTLPDSFSQKVLSELVQQTPIRRLPIKRIIAYAASVALLISIGWWSFSEIRQKQQETAMMLDSFEDPEEAYQEVTAALAMISGAMQQGQQLTMESMSTTEELEILTIQ